MEKSLAENLIKALKKVDRPGSFCVRGSAQAMLPGLEVKKLGPIGLPLTAKQAQELKEQCTQAPYGKGTQTLVDTKVRRVWRMEPKRFALTNPDWDKFVQQIVVQVQKELGLAQKLDAHLYDLLLYEPGSFFLPHKDGEKLDRMVATLVVVLPSPHHGGELVVRHEGRESVIDFANSGGNPFQIQFAAFYADCEHEVRPLRTGHRLCLVYNLTLAKGNKAISAPRAAEHIEEVAGRLAEWAKDPSARKLAITLGHQYTENGLAWDTLKGVDLAVATIVDEAAPRAGCKAYLALLTLWESGSAEGEDYDYGYRSRYGYRNRRGWDDDEDDEEDDELDDEDDTEGNYEMGEIYDSSLTATQGKDRHGNNLPVDKLHVEEDELLDPKALRAVKPKEDFEGYTGNAGMTLDRWYRHAVIILWPESRYFDVLCAESPSGAVPQLKKMVADWRKASKKTAPALRTQCAALASAIVGQWRENSHGYGYSEKPKTDDLFGLLQALDEPALIHTYLSALMVKDLALDPGKALATQCQKQGWQTFEPQLLALFKGTTATSLPRNLRVLEHLASAKPRTDDGWSRLCAKLASELVGTLKRIDLDKNAQWGRGYLNRKENLPGLVRALIACNQPALLADMVVHMLVLPDKYPLDEVQLAALASLHGWLKKNVKVPNAGLAQWLSSCRTQLEALTAAEPTEPLDFRRPASAKCRCEQCRELNQFLTNPREPVHRFSVRQDLRNHLENEIRQQHCDVDCKTERTRSPHTLVCTKNTNSYKAALKKYHQDKERLAMVREIEAELPNSKVAALVRKKRTI